MQLIVGRGGIIASRLLTGRLSKTSPEPHCNPPDTIEPCTCLGIRTPSQLGLRVCLFLLFVREVSAARCVLSHAGRTLRCASPEGLVPTNLNSFIPIHRSPEAATGRRPLLEPTSWICGPGMTRAAPTPPSQQALMLRHPSRSRSCEG